MALTIMVNGHSREFEELAAGASVQDFIAALGLKNDRVALELNGEIAPRAAWDKTALREEDKVEIVHFVGGGSLEH